EIEQWNLFFCSDGAGGFHVVVQVITSGLSLSIRHGLEMFGNDFSFGVEIATRERGDEHGLGADGARVGDVAGEVFAKGGLCVSFELGPFAGHIVVAELN